jgi:hypothetical protein
MTVSAVLIHRSAPQRRADRVRHRRKSSPFPLAATRYRLIQALSDLGIYAERIGARLREERTWARLLEAHRLVGLRDEEQAGQILEQARRLGLQEQRSVERSALRIEHQRFVRLLREELAFQSMTEHQKAADRFEEQVVSWLAGDDPGGEGRGGPARRLSEAEG